MNFKKPRRQEDLHDKLTAERESGGNSDFEANYEDDNDASIAQSSEEDVDSDSTGATSEFEEGLVGEIN